MSIHSPLPKGATIGILGGGQLGRFTAKAARRLEYRVNGWSPATGNPIERYANSTLIAPFTDDTSFRSFARSVDIVTIEFENVPLALLKRFEDIGIPVWPSSSVVAVGQDRWRERSLFDRIGVPYPWTRFVNRSSGAYASKISGFKFPSRLKACGGGYDGKFQRLVHDEREVEQTWLGWGQPDCILQEHLDLVGEVSVMVFRSTAGEWATYDAVQNTHRDSILQTSVWPPSLPPEVSTLAATYARKIAEALNLVGPLAVEFFVTKDKETGAYSVLANEIAPRPHNSYHGTMEGCETSQFEQHVRAIAGLPLGPTMMRCPWKMRNLLGSDIHRLRKFKPNNRVFSHDYGKDKEAISEGRKMGHFTVLME